jgi:hypothetical protein
MTEGPFTWEWIRENLTLPRPNDVLPGRAGCERIAAEFNRAYAGEMAWDSPHVFRAAAAYPRFGNDRWGPTTAIHTQSSKNERRWARHVRALGEVVRTELSAVNPSRKSPFGYRGAPIIPLLEKAIPLITQERPPAGAIEKELERQRKSRPR